MRTVRAAETDDDIDDEKNSLKMNEKKTDFLLIGSKPNLKKSKDFRINIGESFIYASDRLKFLGVILSSDLPWEAHISLIVKKCNAILVSLNRIRHYFTREALNTIIQAYVFPHVTYCLCVWDGAPKVLLHKVQKVINFSARVIVGGRKFDHITPVLKSLAWPSIEKLVGRRDAPLRCSRRCRGGELRVLRVRDHPLSTQVHPLTTKSTPSK